MLYQMFGYSNDRLKPISELNKSLTQVKIFLHVNSSFNFAAYTKMTASSIEKTQAQGGSPQEKNTVVPSDTGASPVKVFITFGFKLLCVFLNFSCRNYMIKNIFFHGPVLFYKVIIILFDKLLLGT